MTNRNVTVSEVPVAPTAVVIYLSSRDATTFIALLKNPPLPAPALIRAADAHRKMVRQPEIAFPVQAAV